MYGLSVSVCLACVPRSSCVPSTVCRNRVRVCRPPSADIFCLLAASCQGIRAVDRKPRPLRRCPLGRALLVLPSPPPAAPALPARVFYARPGGSRARGGARSGSGGGRAARRPRRPPGARAGRPAQRSSHMPHTRSRSSQGNTLIWTSEGKTYQRLTPSSTICCLRTVTLLTPIAVPGDDLTTARPPPP